MIALTYLVILAACVIQVQNECQNQFLYGCTIPVCVIDDIEQSGTISQQLVNNESMTILLSEQRSGFVSPCLTVKLQAIIRDRWSISWNVMKSLNAYTNKVDFTYRFLRKTYKIIPDSWFRVFDLSLTVSNKLLFVIFLVLLQFKIICTADWKKSSDIS